MENIENTYKTFLALTHDRVTAALLTLAAVLNKDKDNEKDDSVV